MTIYYDRERKTRKGVEDWHPYSDKMTKVIMDVSVRDASPTYTEFWFADFKLLTEIEHLDYLNTSEVTTMSNMFLDCHAMKALDLSGFNTEEVESMADLFGVCTSLTELYVNTFDVRHVTDMFGLFHDCSSLKTILCENDWSERLPPECYTDDMFAECTSLIGGKGTAYDDNFWDAAYARPDKGETKPGYFTSMKEDMHTVTFLDRDATELFVEIVKNGRMPKDRKSIRHAKDTLSPDGPNQLPASHSTSPSSHSTRRKLTCRTSKTKTDKAR